MAVTEAAIFQLRGVSYRGEVPHPFPREMHFAVIEPFFPPAGVWTEGFDPSEKGPSVYRHVFVLIGRRNGLPLYIYEGVEQPGAFLLPVQHKWRMA